MDIHISLKLLQVLNGIWFYVTILVMTTVGALYGRDVTRGRWLLFSTIAALGFGFVAISLSMDIASNGCG